MSDPSTFTEAMMEHEHREAMIYRKHGVCPSCRRRQLPDGEWYGYCFCCVPRATQDRHIAQITEWIKNATPEIL
jgi:hypothetical protein